MGFARGLLEGVKRRFGGTVDDEVDPGHATTPRRILVDANTQTFWSRGAVAPTTLIEADNEGGSWAPDRVAAMLADHERGPGVGVARPRGNPAFSEALLVELMRAQQYRRAFALLGPDCQRSWGSVDRFAAANRGDGLRHLRGVTVVAVRFLDQWIDPERGSRHDQVAELDVDYSFGSGERVTAVRRTVHLVAVDGKWRSLCYPVKAGATAG